MKFKISKTFSRASAVLVGSLMAGQAHAQTQTDLISLSSTVGSEVYGLGTLMSNASFIAGGGLTISAALMAKKSADDHGQTPMSKAAGRAFAGACLLGFPWIAGNLVNSLGTGAANGNTGISGATSNRFD